MLVTAVTLLEGVKLIAHRPVHGGHEYRLPRNHQWLGGVDLPRIRGLVQRTIRLSAVALVFMAAAMGCATKGVADLTVADVTAMEDWRICLLHRRAPIGFIPLELNRRGLTCHEEGIEEGILRESTAKTEPSSVLVAQEVPDDLLREEKCNGVRLSVTGLHKPVVRPDRIEGELNKFSQLVALFTLHNQDAARKYVHVKLTYMDGHERNKLLFVKGFGHSSISYAFLLGSPLKRVEIGRCRAFLN